jgi:hypothetical protein
MILQLRFHTSPLSDSSLAGGSESEGRGEIDGLCEAELFAPPDKQFPLHRGEGCGQFLPRLALSSAASSGLAPSSGGLASSG